tara:strand:- start:128 stop:322 length:195 start_codon:yes stop_codon:yes gene_type:complete
MAIKGKKISEIRGSKTKKQEYHLVQLTNDEIGIVLQLVKNSNFNGNMIDSLYHLTSKLQKEYNK